MGVITAAHGIRGEVKLRSFTEQPKDILKYLPLTDEKQTREFSLRLNGETAQSVLIVSINGVTGRNAAETLKNTSLYTLASNLPVLEEAYYPHQLVGLKVVLQNGEIVGVVHGVHNYGAGDIIEIAYADGKMEMFPFKDTFFPEIKEQAKQIAFIPPEIME